MTPSTPSTLSYLVSTAGHAQHQNSLYPHDVRSIVQLIEDGADEFGEEKVVGFTTLDGGRWVCDRYSFPELLALSDQAATSLAQSGVHPSKPEPDARIISLLFPTGLDFLVAWIALMRLGYGVVFIAPQCSPSAINHLLGSSSSTRLVYHPKYADLARSAQQVNPDAIITELSDFSNHSGSSSSYKTSAVAIDPRSISHIFHTSGTSGTPKPIPNTHQQSVTVLPRRAPPSYLSPHVEDGAPPSETAAFTTTPLFHGGVSDLLRAWMARSMIYFYPTSDTPVTSQNVLEAVTACQSPPDPLSALDMSDDQLAERKKRFHVTAFLSVPYILTILSEEIDGPAMKMLEDMDFVSTGGAPLDTRIGDAMVQRGVKLVSRLGSSECGFLLSSHRDYDNEKDWEWLRNDSAYADALSFEAVEADGSSGKERFEMVVTNQWGSKTKSNRDDGSYATGDLYIPHPTKKNVWKYAGRGDDVIVLSNGEKASPGPIETVLRSSPQIIDALVVGADRPQLGVIIFPRSSIDKEELSRVLKPLLAQANQASPSFAQIAEDMCSVIDPSKTTKQLPKSSKGTIQRGLAYEVFGEEIKRLYTSQSTEQGGAPKRSLSEVEAVVKELIGGVAAARRSADSLSQSTDLFSWGVDSLMATRIRAAILRDLNTGGKTLPINVVFERPTIALLSQYIFNLQEDNDDNDQGDQNPHQLMEALAEKYSRFEESTAVSNSSTPEKQGKVVVLTGGTGSLGSFLISELSRLPPNVVAKIICLVRAEDDAAALKRVQGGLRNRGLEVEAGRLQVFAADLSSAQLGLSSAVYGQLTEEVDVVIHAAWPVHFASSLISFEDSIKGTRNLLDLLFSARSHSSTMYYCSSLASVLGRPDTSSTVTETPSDDPSTASPIGYAQSKWVTEKICRTANASAALRDRVCILRIGQLCGDTITAHWNEKEGWPLLVRTAQTTGTLPVLQEKPSWLPVDLAARAVTDVVLEHKSNDPSIYHIAHPAVIDWHTILEGLKTAGLAFEEVSPREWLRKVEESSEDVEANPSRQMLSMWQAAYSSEADTRPEPVVDTTNAQAASKTLRNIQPVGIEQIGKMVQAWRKTGFLQ